MPKQIFHHHRDSYDGCLRRARYTTTDAVYCIFSLLSATWRAEDTDTHQQNKKKQHFRPWPPRFAQPINAPGTFRLLLFWLPLPQVALHAKNVALKKQKRVNFARALARYSRSLVYRRQRVTAGGKGGGAYTTMKHTYRNALPSHTKLSHDGIRLARPIPWTERYVVEPSTKAPILHSFVRDTNQKDITCFQPLGWHYIILYRRQNKTNLHQISKPNSPLDDMQPQQAPKQKHASMHTSDIKKKKRRSRGDTQRQQHAKKLYIRHQVSEDHHLHCR